MPRPSDNDRLDFLDGLRGLAALYVMLGHAKWLLWRGHFAADGPLERVSAAALGLLDYGHEAVIFFFVLSGFVIHLRQARARTADPRAPLNVPGYYRRRALRIYPPLVLAMVWTLACDALAAKLGYGPYYLSPHFLDVPEIMHPSHSPLTALGNLLFVNGTYVPGWGTDTVLWSLKYEGWFYLLYPLFFLINRRSTLAAAVTVAELFLLTLYPIWPVMILRDVFIMMPVWWLGVLLAEIYAGRVRTGFGGPAFLCLLLPVLVAKKLPALLMPLGWGLFFSGVISLCFFLLARGRSLGLLARLKPAGDMSYSLYLLHFPPFLLLSGYLMDGSADRLLPTHLGWAALAAAGAVVLGWVAHLAVERPFLSRKRLSYA